MIVVMAIVAGIGLYWLSCLLLVCWIHSVVTAQNGQWRNCEHHHDTHATHNGTVQPTPNEVQAMQQDPQELTRAVAQVNAEENFAMITMMELAESPSESGPLTASL